MQEFISISVQDPKLHKEDIWNTYVDYEICLQTNSMCFRKTRSCVRRRYSEFVWLRHCLEQNALVLNVPKLPSWNPFFNLKNEDQVTKRMKGLQEFLENALQVPLLLSDSKLHLFLQSGLSITKIMKCSLGKTKYTVAEAIQRSSSDCIKSLEDKLSEGMDELICVRERVCPEACICEVVICVAVFLMAAKEAVKDGRL
uniref:Sorting nexin 10a n=1 Tax=Oryzias latipes TaxID=8090 RepID=A0A3P9K4N7_ORYLA